MRWIEMSAFSDPIMRSHPSSAADNPDNFQIWDDEYTILFMKKFTEIHVALADYKMKLMQEASDLGSPFTRAMMLHYPDSQAMRGIIDQFMLGENIVMAPIFKESQTVRDVVLPGPATWTRLFSGEQIEVQGDSLTLEGVSCEMGLPAVYYRDTEGYTISDVLDQYLQVEAFI